MLPEITFNELHFVVDYNFIWLSRSPLCLQWWAAKADKSR